MQNKFGVMQGRLLPKYQGRYQAFPIGSWQSEFNIAKHCGIHVDGCESDDDAMVMVRMIAVAIMTAILLMAA